MDPARIGLLGAGLESGTAAGVAVLSIAALVGLGLWLFGSRALRLGFGALGGAVGGVAGWGISEGLTTEVSVWAPVGVGMVLGLVIGLVALRFMVSAALALTLGALAPLGVMAGHELAGRPMGQEESRIVGAPLSGQALLLDGPPMVSETEFEAMRLLAGERAQEMAAEAGFGEGTAAREKLIEQAERARVFADRLAEEVTAELERLSARDRAVLALSGLTGLAVGFALGMWLPRWSGAVVGAGAGVGLWLPSGLALAREAGAPMGWASADPVLWVGVWAGLTALGIGVQWIARRRRADKA